MKPVLASVYLLTKFRPKSRCHGKMFCAPTFVCQHFAAEALPEAWPTGKPWACVCGCVKILDTNCTTDLTARVCSQTHGSKLLKSKWNNGKPYQNMTLWAPFPSYSSSLLASDPLFMVPYQAAIVKYVPPHYAQFDSFAFCLIWQVFGGSYAEQRASCPTLCQRPANVMWPKRSYSSRTEGCQLRSWSGQAASRLCL